MNTAGIETRDQPTIRRLILREIPPLHEKDDNGLEATHVNSATIDRPALVQTGQRLEYLTLAFNSIEGVVGIVAGPLAGSVALMAFGLDSGIEVASGSALLWRFGRDADRAARERAEVIAMGADKGDSIAQSNIGEMYEEGQGVAKEYVQAFHWYQLAAEQGQSTAQYHLGMMYPQGRGIKQSA